MKILTIMMICLLSFSTFAKGTMAVNIALSVNEALKARVEKINADIKVVYPETFVFDSTHLPHMTLLQMYIDPEKLDELYQKLSVIKLQALPLKVKDFDTTNLFNTPVLSLLNLAFEKSEALTALQKTLVVETKGLRKEDGDKSAFYDPNDMSKQFINYVKTFARKESGEAYSPHITLGLVKKWEADNSVFRPREEFVFDEIMVVQIGSYGTARKVLKTFKMGTTTSDK